MAQLLVKTAPENRTVDWTERHFQTNENRDR